MPGLGSLTLTELANKTGLAEKPCPRWSSKTAVGRPKVTVLVCTLNEEKNLPHVLPRIPEWVDEVLLADGHSTDKTVDVATRLRPDIHILYQPGKGKGDALRYGLEHAQGDIIVTVDADGATDPREMYSFVKPLLNGYDFAKGSRFARRMPSNRSWHRILGNFIITLVFDALFFARYTDLCSGYNAFWRERLRKVMGTWPSDGFENEPLINARAKTGKLKVVEVAHTDSGRLTGDVKEVSLRQGFKAIKTIIRERFRG